MVAGSDLYHLGIYAICNCYKDFRINANLQIIYHFPTWQDLTMYKIIPVLAKVNSLQN